MHLKNGNGFAMDISDYFFGDNGFVPLHIIAIFKRYQSMHGKGFTLISYTLLAIACQVTFFRTNIITRGHK